MEFPVVTENDPTFGADFRKPFVISCVLREPERAFGIVMIFDGKRRACHPDSFGKAFSKIPIKIER